MPMHYQQLFKFKTQVVNLLSVHIKNQFSRRTLKMDNRKRLAAFDFDSTIIVDNSDTVVRDLLPKDVIIKYSHSTAEGWTNYMQNVFEQLHSKEVDESTIVTTVATIPPVDGMCQLIKELSEDLNFDIIIISDSNSYFITKWVEKHKLASYFKQIFTNPGKFVDGLLKIQMFHVQDSCTLSTRNLCKGQILEDFVKSQKESGVTYNQLVYVGDGQNDFCPILRLSSGDLACCREGFKCANIVMNVKEGKPFRNVLYEVKSDVLVWKTGFDILNAVKQIVNKDFVQQ